MKAIDTRYNGRTYRSRLEARWAVFLDALGVRFQYEPEGFRFSDGTMYLPDFWLPDHNCWVETKAVEPSERELRKIKLLASEGGFNVWVFIGQPDPATLPKMLLIAGERFNDGFVEEYEDARFWDVFGFEDYDVAQALESAASMRFEHSDRAHGLSRASDVLEQFQKGRIGAAIRLGNALQLPKGEDPVA